MPRRSGCSPRCYGSTTGRCGGPRLTAGVLGLTFLVTGYLFVIIPKGFLPDEDTGTVFAFTEAAQDISFDAMMRNQQAAAAIVGRSPYVQQYFSGIGASGVGIVPNTGRIFMTLKPRDQRPSSQQIAQDLRR